MFSCKSVLTVCSYRAQSNEICSYGRVSRGSLPWVRRHGSCTYRQSNTTIAISTLDIVEQRNYGTVFSTTDNANWSGFLVQSFYVMIQLIMPSPIPCHPCDVIMNTMSSQITSISIIYSIVVFSAEDQGKHQSSPSMAFVRGIHRSPVNSPHKGLVTRKIFPFDDVIMGFG